jgi:hypothetical protein
VKGARADWMLHLAKHGPNRRVRRAARMALKHGNMCSIARREWMAMQKALDGDPNAMTARVWAMTNDLLLAFQDRSQSEYHLWACYCAKADYYWERSMSRWFIAKGWEELA